MPEYLTPGVYVEEIDNGSKPIEGVGTNTAAFIGYARSGEFGKPVFISSWTQFCQLFGEDENAFIPALCKELGMTLDDLLKEKQAKRMGWMAFAQRSIEEAIRTKKPDITVRDFRHFLETYNISQDGSPYLEIEQEEDGTRYKRNYYLAHAVSGYYENGGSRAYIVRVPRREDVDTYTAARALQAAGNGKGKVTPALPAQAEIGPVTFRALEAGREGNNIKVKIEPNEGGSEFRVTFSRGDTVESFPPEPGKTLKPREAATAVKTHSKLVAMEVKQADFKIDLQEMPLAGGKDEVRTGGALAAAPLPNGLANIEANDFEGNPARRTGIHGLEPIEEVNMVSIPDLMAGLFRRPVFESNGRNTVVGEEELDSEAWAANQQMILDVQCKLVAYCERMGDRMAILDPLPSLSAQEMQETTMRTPYNSDHGQAAIYYPWIQITDPVYKGRRIFAPPSGHIAGVWSRVGVERGVHKAPANEALLGAVGLETDLTKGDQAILNPIGVNCIRSFPGQGIRVWGARTLATVGNPSWKYVNVRRLFNYLEKSMERGLQWVVFEPNDHDLWGRVRRNLSAFLWTEWKEGKLFGAVPSEAFYVKCDAETNPQEMIDLGRLYVEIGVNPVKPAEFVIVRMGQWSGGGSVSEQ